MSDASKLLCSEAKQFLASPTPSDPIHPAQPSRAPPPTPVSHLRSGPLHSRPAQVDDAEWQRLAAADFSSPAALEALPVAERWVVSSLHATVEAITAAHERCVCVCAACGLV